MSWIEMLGAVNEESSPAKGVFIANASWSLSCQRTDRPRPRPRRCSRPSWRAFTLVRARRDSLLAAAPNDA
jgi:hypothetical protein